MSNIRAISQGCGAQTVIFFSSVLSSAVICPALGRYRDHVITVLMALGAACLAGDAIFHLMPHALNPDIHHEHDGSTSTPTSNGHVVLWRSLLVVCSIYLFYLFHLFFHFMEGGHSHSHAISPGDTCENLQLLQRDTEMTPLQRDNEMAQLQRDTGSKPKLPGSKEKKALIWMMVFGEVLHTATDGLAIGAAFSYSAADGLSTSLAVLFHEIPHAVGAFAIFVSSGVPVRRALCLLSGCYIFSYVGVVIGAVLGASFYLTAWIFAVIAGMFLYIALAEMIPEMFISMTSRTENKRCFLLLQNLGLVFGFAVMMLLAAFEDKIRGALQ